jgi:molecular chaperone GrpE
MIHKKKHGKGEPEITPKELEDLKKKAEERDEFEDKWLRVHADYENTRKRLEKEKTDHVKFANEGIISKLFPIMDNFDMAFDAMGKAEDKDAVMDGMKLVQKEFHRILEENGVERIETEGKEFDPNLHEAVNVLETEEYPEDSVIEEVRPGYLLNKRLLRPAQVVVSKNTK